VPPFLFGFGFYGPIGWHQRKYRVDLALTLRVIYRAMNGVFMRTLICLALLAGLVAGIAVSEPAAADDEPGYLVLSVGSAATSNDNKNIYRLYYHRTDGTGADTVEFVSVDQGHPLGFLFQRAFHPAPDYSDKGEGIVAVRKLPPGDYEIYNFEVDASGWALGERMRSPNDFHLGFHIAAGRSKYIGNFAAVGVGTPGVWNDANIHMYFSVSDESVRDIAIAKTKVPTLPEPSVSIVDVRSAGTGLVRGAN